jgi:hypothetical protein
MLAFAHVLDFLAHELAGLRRGRLAFPCILARSSNSFFTWHGITPCPRDEQNKCRAWLSQRSSYWANIEPQHHTGTSNLTMMEHRRDPRMLLRDERISADVRGLRSESFASGKPISNGYIDRSTKAMQ